MKRKEKNRPINCVKWINSDVRYPKMFDLTGVTIFRLQTIHINGPKKKRISKKKQTVLENLKEKRRGGK